MALVFFWPDLEQSVRIEGMFSSVSAFVRHNLCELLCFIGKAEMITDQESTDYFVSRPKVCHHVLSHRRIFLTVAVLSTGLPIGRVGLCSELCYTYVVSFSLSRMRYHTVHIRVSQVARLFLIIVTCSKSRGT